MSAKCLSKHTRYDPTDEEWACPRCGEANPEHFYIYDDAPDADPDCPRLHADALIVCERCGYEGTGRALSLALRRKHNLVVCPCCKGRGFIPHTAATAIASSPGGRRSP